MNLADELKSGPKLKANPEMQASDIARQMYREGKTKKEIGKHFSLGHVRVNQWLRRG